MPQDGCDSGTSAKDYYKKPTPLPETCKERIKLAILITKQKMNTLKQEYKAIGVSLFWTQTGKKRKQLRHKIHDLKMDLVKFQRLDSLIHNNKSCEEMINLYREESYKSIAISKRVQSNSEKTLLNGYARQDLNTIIFIGTTYKAVMIVLTEYI
tara:strand:- start:220923 stop:221384 length:462 start_codon:yes stop_codon:yes gene_type:complete